MLNDLFLGYSEPIKLLKYNKNDHNNSYNCYFLNTQTVKNLSAVQETQVRSLGQEDLLEKGMAIHSGILAWEIPWTEESDGLQSMELEGLGMTDRLPLSLFTFTYVEDTIPLNLWIVL